MIPIQELQIDFVRSSGAGGQNVNKVSSKAQLRWNVDKSAAFTPWQKNRIKQKLATRMNLAGEIVLSAQAERSQLQNRTAVIQRLEKLVAAALQPELPRVPTRPTRGSKERRLQHKKNQSERKQGRRPIRHE